MTQHDPQVTKVSHAGLRTQPRTAAVPVPHASFPERQRRDDAPDIAPERILQVGFGFWGSMALLSAVELGLFTELGSGALDRATLEKRLGLHPRAARDFLDTLVALRLLERNGDRYANTPETSLYLDRNRRTYIGGLLDRARIDFYPTWASLSTALRTGAPQVPIDEDEDLFDSMYKDPEAMRDFARAMTGLSIPLARTLARRFPWANYRSFIDVGTAEGAAAVEIGLAHPHLAGGGFDLPPVRSVFEPYVQRHGLGDRLQFHPGDFLNEALPSADVLVMGHILHDWNLAIKRELLAKAHAALPDGGVLIVYDRMLDDERRRNAAGLLMSLHMLLNTRGGFDYTGAQCIDWMRDAGFAVIQRTALSRSCVMVAGVKRAGKGK